MHIKKIQYLENQFKSRNRNFRFIHVHLYTGSNSMPEYLISYDSHKAQESTNCQTYNKLIHKKDIKGV